MYNTNKKNTNKKHFWFWLCVLLIGVAAVLGLLELTGQTHFFRDKPAPPTTINQQTKGEGQSSAGSQTSNEDGTDQGGTASSQKDGDATNHNPTVLLAPEGTFVSNHHPSLAGGGRDVEQSTCTTTPGASCQIVFAKDGETKRLPSKTTDAGGGAYWTWKLKDIGLTRGVWKITAIVTLNGQTKTTDDSLNLEVSD